MREDVENTVVEFTNYAAKIYSWFSINSVTPIETITSVKKKMSFKMLVVKYSFEFKEQPEQHVKLLADSHPGIINK